MSWYLTALFSFLRNRNVGFYAGVPDFAGKKWMCDWYLTPHLHQFKSIVWAIMTRKSECWKCADAGWGDYSIWDSK